MDALQLIPFLVNAVPPAYWVTIGHVLTYALLALGTLYVLLWALDKLDAQDGKLDHPKVRAAYQFVRTILQYALVKFFPLPRMPIIEGLKALKDLQREPHPDDAPLVRDGVR